jgi:murein DD-endopeptidase MepM/ murein hydrolase activator NlpD
MKREKSPHPFGARLTSRSFFWGRRLIGQSQKAEMPRGTGAKDAQKGKPGMSVMERIWAWLHATFPERQIYIRSHGRVQFFTFGPTLQATTAGLSLIFLFWVAFATVNVIFKDRIIAAKDHRYQQMQSAYENRVADLQISYDELNGALVNAEGQFQSKADALQAEQNSIVKLLDRKHAIETTLSGGSAVGAVPMPDTSENAPAADSVGAASDADAADIGGSSDLTVMPQPAAPQPRTAKTKSSFLDLGNTFRHLASLLFGHHDAATPQIAAAYAQHPALRALAAQTARVAGIGHDETVLMTRTQGELSESVANLQGVMRRAGIDPQQFARKAAASDGVGGPEIPLDSVHVEGLGGDSGFQNAYLHATAVLDQLNGLLVSMRHIPLTTPVSGPQFSRSSGFGPRIDPFTGRYAFHPGIDFAGPWGSTVLSTAPGVVVFAGNRGAYGNMVEIDHGYGIHTRYGHLSSIITHVGAVIAKGAPVGRLGSTGRSTGPHVHYEIWYDNQLRNPSNFIEAGRHVL